MPQEFRSIDGSGNNLQDVTLNATGTPMVRIGDAHFNSDGTILETVNPRVVSNQVVGQGNADVPNKEGLSEYIFAWGQFIDHDLDLLRSDGVTPIPITIPADDQFLTPRIDHSPDPLGR